MRNKFIPFTYIIIFVLLISGCNLGSTPPAELTEEPVQTSLPLSTETQTSLLPETSAPELITVDLAGPPMEVGSKYTYVDGAILVAVPGGPFIMGYNFADNPVREITVGDFWIYSAKVTNQQYAFCVELGECSSPNPVKNPDFGNYRYINFPVTGVNHSQATEYCTFVHGRLPTEAEWEKTARGPEGNVFPWGDGAPNCSLLNYKFCEGRTTYINEYEEGISYYGAFDMSGNAREWVADWYDPKFNTDLASLISDPLGPLDGEKRSIRGSSFQDSADPSISAHRFSLDPIETLPDLGFRCVVEDPTYFAPWCQQLAYIGTGPNGEEANCTPSVLCNDVSISQGLVCEGDSIDYVIVKVNVEDTPPDGWSYSVPGCTQIGPQTATEDRFKCDPGPVGPAQVEGSCTDGASCVSSCPPHYNKVGDICEWDGSGTTGTACLPGATYDPLTQCCSSADGSATDFGLCPAGYYPLDGACVSNPAAVHDSELQAIDFDDEELTELVCDPPSLTEVPGDDDSDDDVCQPQTCGRAEKWCQSTCSCIYMYSQCP